MHVTATTETFFYVTNNYRQDMHWKQGCYQQKSSWIVIAPFEKQVLTVLQTNLIYRMHKM